jgi:hypothetical protein
MIINPPQPGSDFGFYNRYTSKVMDKDLFSALDAAHNDTLTLLAPLDDATMMHRYAEGKWSIKEIIQHLIDSERIFTLRAARFSRGEYDPLPAYDIHSFVASSGADRRSKDSLLNEWNNLRNATKLQFAGFDPEILENKGPVRDTHLTVRSHGFLIAGHEMHHVGVIKEKYLTQQSV